MAGKLKPLDVERETRPGKYADGDGLYLVVKGATSKNWIYRYTKDGRERWLGLGSLKDVSLKAARMARDAARLRVKGDRTTPGVDIVQEKRAAREEAKAVEIKLSLPAFEECAEIYIREPQGSFAAMGQGNGSFPFGRELGRSGSASPRQFRRVHARRF